MQRAIVHHDVHDGFVEALVRAADAQKAGDPADADTDLGPAITHEARDRVHELVEEAVAGGATSLTGGTFGDDYLRPTVLDGVASGTDNDKLDGVLGDPEDRSEACPHRPCLIVRERWALWAPSRAARTMWRRVTRTT